MEGGRAGIEGGKGRRDTGEGRRLVKGSRGKCAGRMGEWRRVTCITCISRGEERSPSPIMVCAVSCTLGLGMS